MLDSRHLVREEVCQKHGSVPPCFARNEFDFVVVGCACAHAHGVEDQDGVMVKYTFLESVRTLW